MPFFKKTFKVGIVLLLILIVASSVFLCWQHTKKIKLQKEIALFKMAIEYCKKNETGQFKISDEEIINCSELGDYRIAPNNFRIMKVTKDK